MIIDHIANVSFYYGLSARIKDGLLFLKTADLRRLPLGKIELKGEGSFAVVSEYITRDEVSARWEAHRRYIDIQYIVRGTEAIGYQCVSNLKVVRRYDKADDVLFLRGSGTRLIVGRECFVIFWPQDAHQPGLTVLRPQTVRKVVVKVPLN